MKNADGKIIYIGKANNLRSRVRSYFHESADHSRKIKRMVFELADIEWIIVGSELEALILEMNLIKKHLPEYNVRLKDDKRYPFIRVHWADPFPKVTVTRNQVKDGSRYFGPYTSVWAVHQTLDLLRKLFQYRSCDRDITGEDSRACLYYDIKLCTGPCIGMINQEDYRQMIEDLCQFLEGQTDPILDRLKKRMEKSSAEMEYEKAAVLRDQINAIEKVVERQKIISSKSTNSDVIALARANGDSCIQIFFIRNGRLIGREYFILEGTEDEKESEIISQFIKQFYAEASSIPQEILLPNELEETMIIQQWLRQNRGGKKVHFKIPQRGSKRDLINLATENAVETLDALKAQWESDTNRQSEALAQIQEALQLEKPPNRMECYDISNTQGTFAVGSMVVFEKGTPSKKLYRRFNIKSVVGPDDFASMEEVLERRFKRYQAAQTDEKVGKKVDASFGVLPDLLVVDGGKGQLSRAVRVLEKFDLQDRVTAVGIAKQHELIYKAGENFSRELPRNSQGLYLMQRIRDEAHRFAITAHRNRRKKSKFISRLDQIKGIGPAKKKALLKEFGSIKKIAAAAKEELAAIPGITEELAQDILENLNNS